MHVHSHNKESETSKRSIGSDKKVDHEQDAALRTIKHDDPNCDSDSAYDAVMDRSVDRSDGGMYKLIRKLYCW